MDEQLARAFESAAEPEPADATLTLEQTALFVAEPASTFRRRLCYRRALVSGVTERRLRFSRRVLQEIRESRLQTNGTAIPEKSGGSYELYRRSKSGLPTSGMVR